MRFSSRKSDLFPVRVGLRQGCPMSPVLFIIFMDRISRRSQGIFFLFSKTISTVMHSITCSIATLMCSTTCI
uniref:Reverse transcriptase domain-containing protein n=1 Tax=Neogobius melanostomus TaxID=47308 RepID=A0A8C6U0H1_9GOBI